MRVGVLVAITQLLRATRPLVPDPKLRSVRATVRDKVKDSGEVASMLLDRSLMEPTLRSVRATVQDGVMDPDGILDRLRIFPKLRSVRATVQDAVKGRDGEQEATIQAIAVE